MSCIKHHGTLDTGVSSLFKIILMGESNAVLSAYTLYIGT